MDNEQTPTPQSKTKEPRIGFFKRVEKHSNPLLVLLLIIVIALSWQWFQTYRDVSQLRYEMAKRLDEASNVNRESHIFAVQAQEAVREAQAKLAVLENKISESQNQQTALEALYKELSQNRDDWTISEIEQMLTIASQQLQLAGNVPAALTALQTADAKLQRNDKAQFTGLRKAINKDITRLKAVPSVDTIGISLRLDNLIGAIDMLPFAIEERTEKDKSLATKEPSLRIRLVQEMWFDNKQMVRIQNTQKPEIPLLSPNQAFFLRQNLKLRLLGARLALLSRDDASFHADLGAAQDWLIHYYDVKAKPTVNTIAVLRQLSENKINLDVPDLSASLDAIRSYKLSRERGVR
jgi:uroporphyrin-3 C-methyltransferase